MSPETQTSQQTNEAAAAKGEQASQETTTASQAGTQGNAPAQKSGEQKQNAKGGQQSGDKKGGGKKDRRGGGRRGGERAKPEFDHTVIDIRRVTRVVAGGRRFSFRVTVVAGNRQGKVGVGVGKATDTPLAIEKAFRDAKDHMIDVNHTAGKSIPCEVEAKFCGSKVLILPSPGRGIIAGSSVRPVIELAGLNDVTTKLLSRSKNQLNNARAAVAALGKLPAPVGEDAPKTAQKAGESAEAQKEAKS